MRKIVLIICVFGLFTMSSMAQEGKVFIKSVADTSSSTANVQTEKQDRDLFIKIKEGADVKIIINGKKYDSDVIDILDQDIIASAFIPNKETAMKKYNEPNVVVILTKKEKEERAKQRIEKGTKDPLVLVDGKQISKAEFKAYNADDIESVNVLKDEESLKKYNTEVGVILITTKKNKK